jgi:hypothetical protein
MDNLGIRAKLAYVARDPVIKASANGNQQITMVHGHIGLIGTMHAKHT